MNMREHPGLNGDCARYESFGLYGSANPVALLEPCTGSCRETEAALRALSTNRSDEETHTYAAPH